MKKLTATNNMKKTESILAEELSDSEIRYRSLFESTKDGILILNAETGMIVDVNPFLIDLLGYSKEEFIEKSIWEIGAFKDIFENKEKFLELQKEEYVRYDDLPLVASNGRKIQVEFISNVYLVNNSKVIQCNIRDITERKETEEVLEKTRKELEEIKETADELNLFTENIIDTIREPLLAIDKDLRVIKASRSFYNFFKVTAEETVGKLIYELGNHQWDIPKLKELLEEIIPEKNSFDNYEVEHNFSTIGKRVMLLNARQVKRAFGKEKVILLAIEDITERKAKEDSLKEIHRATSDSLNSLLNHMHAPIIIWDTSMIIKRFNHKFEILSGYNSDEVVDKRIDLLFPKEKNASTLKLLKKHINNEHEVTEIEILTKDNKIKTVLWNSSRILDEEGKNIVATISQDITSRKLTEDALIFSETRYRRLFESAQDGILILDAKTGKIVDVNPFLIDLLGFSKEEFIEKSIWEIGSFQDIFENKEKFFELQQDEYVRYDDLPLVTSDGHEIHVEFVSNVYMSNNIKVIQCNIRDVTERIIIQNEIKFQADLINNVGQAVIATNLLGKVIYWNNTAEKIYGWSASEAIGENIINLTPTQQSNDQAIEIMKELSTGNTWAGEFYVQRKDGSSFPAFVTDTPILDSKGELTGIIGISSDITERKRTEVELIEAKEKAEESDRLKTAFLHNISHEIRTPMNAIVGFSGFLNDPDLTAEKRQEFTEIIIQGSDQLLAIIDDLISIATIEAGLEKVHETEININSVCKLINDLFSHKAIEKGINLSLKCALADNDAILLTDATKLTQILNNLIGNALKFTQQGFINFGYTIKDKQLEFYVEDSGMGIPLDMQEIIFTRFRQVESSNDQLFGGSGVGLSISKAYVEMLGGKIWLDSELGNGTVFYFNIPYKKTIQIKSSEILSIKGLDLEFKYNKTILIAEDDYLNFMFLNELLSKTGINIIRAVNGIEAVELCKSNPNIDLVLMDIKMPKMDGYEATKLIKEFKPNLPIIALTAYSTKADRDKALACGCSDFISKPLKKEYVLSKIKEQLIN
jgi:PAS domain S-box-containing protein